MSHHSTAVCTLQIIKQPPSVDGVDKTLEFTSRGGTVGRSSSATYILPDPNRFVSSQHLAIAFDQDHFTLTDTSSNGTFLNDSPNPVGMGNTVSLKQGDRISFGQYEAMVRLSVSEGATVIPGVSGTSDTDEIFYHGQIPDTGLHPSVPDVAVNQREVRGDLSAVSNPPGIGDEKETSSPSLVEVEAKVIDQLIAALGLPPASFSDESKVDLVPKVADLLHVTIKGLMGALATRAEIKNSLRLDMTTIQPRENNPLKFSVSAHEALRLLLNADEGTEADSQAYASADEAIKEAYLDFSDHQAATLSAMESSVHALLKRFDPSELAIQFDEQSVNSLFSGSKKAQYWESYRHFYEKSVKIPDDTFSRFFADNFAQFYDEQLQRLKLSRP